MESNGSIQRGSSSALEALDLQVSPKKLDEARVSAKFSHSHRTVSKAEPSLSLKVEQQKTDSEVKSKPLSGRDVQDVSKSSLLNSLDLSVSAKSEGKDGASARDGSGLVDALDLSVSPEKLDEARQSSKTLDRRVVSDTEPEVSLKVEQQETELESEPEAQKLSERDVKDVSDDRPGVLRRAGGFVAKGIKKAGHAAYDYGTGKLKSGKELARSVKNGGKQLVHHPVDTTVALAQGAYNSGKEKLSSAKQSARALGGAVADGAKAFKENPKGVTKGALKSLATGTAKSIRKRGASLRSKVTKLVPARVRNASLPRIKSLFSRSARQVPPQPSTSVKAAVDTASQKAERFEKLQTDAVDTMQQAKSSKANFELLGKLLDDPSGFYKSGFEAELTFPEGQTVLIAGDGLERAQVVDKAMKFANQQKSMIREGVKSSKEFASEVKSGNKELKSERKQEFSELRKEASTAEKAQYESDTEDLKTAREELKEEVRALKARVKERGGGLNEAVFAEKKRLKGKVRSGETTLKGLNQKIKKEVNGGKQSLQGMKKELYSFRDTEAKFDKQLSKAKAEPDKAAAKTGLEKARNEIADLTTRMTSKKLEIEEAVKELREDAARLEEQISHDKQSLEEFDIESVKSDELKQIEDQLKQLKEKLKANGESIDKRRQQYRLGKAAIKKMK